MEASGIFDFGGGAVAGFGAADVTLAVTVPVVVGGGLVCGRGSGEAS